MNKNHLSVYYNVFFTQINHLKSNLSKSNCFVHDEFFKSLYII